MPGSAAPFVDISGQDLLSPAQSSKALGLDKRPLGPGLNGWVTARDVYRAVLTQEPYPVRMLLSFGTNVLVSQPDAETARKALAALEFHVHADFFVNATARYADIVLPVATSWEREGLRAGFDGSLEGLRRVQLRQARHRAGRRGEVRHRHRCGAGERLGLSDRMFDGDVDKGHDAVLGKAGLSVAQLRAAPAGVVVDGSVTLDAHAIDDRWQPARLSDADAQDRALFGAAAARRAIRPFRPCAGRRASRRRALSPAPRQRQDGCLLPQPASQYCVRCGASFPIRSWKLRRPMPARAASRRASG